MEQTDRIKKLIEVFRVANDDVIGNTASQIFNLKWKEGISARNQAHKILDELALTNHIQKGKGFYAVKGYQGLYKEHDRLVTKIIARLLLLKFPVTIFREVSFSIGLRSDAVALIGKNGKALCAVIEVANSETPSYLGQKVIAWLNWKDANRHLSELFKTNIPSFSLVVSGMSHPDAIDFETFIEEIRI